MSPLPPTESLSRFIFSKRHYGIEENRVKFGAFVPLRNPQTSVLEVSVFRISGLSDEQIWSMGESEVAQRSGRTLNARGDLTVASVEAKQLQVVSDDIPLRHANIVGWPEEKSEQKLKAIELAASALLRVK